jgi:hypothetical protein
MALAAVMIIAELLVIRKINLLGIRSMVSNLTGICLFDGHLSRQSVVASMRVVADLFCFTLLTP